MTTQTEVLINSLMEQAQVFASSWSLIGGRFDGGNAMHDAEEAKAELRQMIEEALQITWVWLTDEKITKSYEQAWNEDRDAWSVKGFAYTIEAKLKDKNT